MLLYWVNLNHWDFLSFIILIIMLVYSYLCLFPFVNYFIFVIYQIFLSPFILITMLSLQFVFIFLFKLLQNLCLDFVAIILLLLTVLFLELVLSWILFQYLLYICGLEMRLIDYFYFRFIIVQLVLFECLKTSC